MMKSFALLLSVSLFARSATAQESHLSDTASTDTAFYQDVTWSPDGKRLAMSVFQHGQYDIVVMNSDGTGRRKLTDNPLTDYWTTWSRDGKRVGYASKQSSVTRICVTHLDSGTTQCLTDTSWECNAPSWSPDGRQIAFTRKVDGLRRLYVMNADGSGAQLVPDTAAEHWNPVWSPDGRLILFYSNFSDGKTDHLYTVHPDGTGLTQLTRQGHNIFPGWSPDGKQIIFARSGADGHEGVFVMNADGSEIKRVIEDSFYARWSPDGMKIVYLSGGWPRSRVHVMSADGKNVVCLTP